MTFKMRKWTIPLKHQGHFDEAQAAEWELRENEVRDLALKVYESQCEVRCPEDTDHIGSVVEFEFIRLLLNHLNEIGHALTTRDAESLAYYYYCGTFAGVDTDRAFKTIERLCDEVLSSKK